MQATIDKIRNSVFGPTGSVKPDNWKHHLVTCVPKDETKKEFDCFDGALVFSAEDKIVEMPKIPVFALRKKVFEKKNPGHTLHLMNEDARKKYTIDFEKI